MTIMRRTIFAWVVLICTFFFSQAALAETVSFTTTPDHVNVSAMYKPANIQINGTAPKGSDIYIKLVSANIKVPLNRVGKVGPFWMTVQNVNVAGTPKLYQVWSSSDINNLPAGLADQMGIDGSFKYATAGAKISDGKQKAVTGDQAQEFINAMVKMNKDSGLYALRNKSVKVDQNGNFNASIQMPAQMPQGSLKVEVYAVKNNQLLVGQSKSLKVASVGIAGYLKNLAGTDGVVYGVLAVCVALFIGALIDWLFRLIGGLFSGKAAEAGTKMH